MKRLILSLFLTLATLLSLCGCSDMASRLDKVINELDSSVSVGSETDNSSENENYSEFSESAVEDSFSSESQTEIIENTTQYYEQVIEDGEYTAKEEVALYLHNFGHLPSNYIKKSEAKDLGWDNSKGNLWEVAVGKSIGGDYFGNYEERLPLAQGRKWFECDVNYNGGYRGSERIIYSNDSLIYYTSDHYETFTQLY